MSSVCHTADLELVCRIKNGDREALESLVMRHQDWVYNIVLRMVYHPEDAEDAAQEVLIKLLTKLSTFEGRSSFRTWLYRIVVSEHGDNAPALVVRTFDFQVPMP